MTAASRRADLRVTRAQHGVRCGSLRPLPAWAGLVCKDGPVFRYAEWSVVGGEGPVKRRPSLAVWKFASCDGCQLTLLDCEDELLASPTRSTSPTSPRPRRGRGPVRPLARRGLDHHPATTPSASARPRAVALPRHHRRLRHGRRHAGAAQLRRCRRVPVDRLRQPEYISTLGPPRHLRPRAGRLRAARLPDRPAQLLEVISAFLNERRPAIPPHSVCIECKRRGNVCVMVAHGTPCLGPVTHAGCGALCPSYDRGCYGCFGPMEDPKPVAERLARAARRRARSTSCASTAPSTRTPRPSATRASAMSAERGTRRTLSTEALARVEGEGAMYVRIRDGEVEDGAAADLRAAALLRGAAARPRLHRGRRTSPRGSAASARWPTR